MLFRDVFCLSQYADSRHRLRTHEDEANGAPLKTLSFQEKGKNVLSAWRCVACICCF